MMEASRAIDIWTINRRQMRPDSRAGGARSVRVFPGARWLRSAVLSTASIFQLLSAVAVEAQQPEAAPAAADPEPARVLGTLLFDDGTPVSQARIHLVGTARSTFSDADGRFFLVDDAAGAEELEIHHIALGVLRYRLPAEDYARRRLALTLPRRVIELEGVDVWARTRADEYRRSIGTAVRLLIREDIEEAWDAWDVGDLIRRRLPMVDARTEIYTESDLPIRQLCVVGRVIARSLQGGLHCAAVVIDGFRIIDGGADLLDLGPDDLESIEYIPPIRAGALYGTGIGNRGVVVVWTRGNGPFAARNRR